VVGMLGQNVASVTVTGSRGQSEGGATGGKRFRSPLENFLDACSYNYLVSSFTCLGCVTASNQQVQFQSLIVHCLYWNY